MPAGKPATPNTMWLPVVVFVILFLVTLVCAFVFYVKAEDYRDINDELRSDLSKLATEKEQRSYEKIVGRPKKNEDGRGKMSYLGTMNSYLDQMLSAIMGELPLDTPAEVKINAAIAEINDTIELLGEDATAMYGPDDIDLLQEIASLKSKLDTANENAQDMEDLKNDIQDDFDLYIESANLQAKRLSDERDRFQKEADEIRVSYNELKNDMQDSADDRVKTYMNRTDRAKQQLRERSAELARTQKDLDKTTGELDKALLEREAIKPRPDAEVLAYRPDARIVDVDMASGLVYLDIGSDDHVYRGLTFGVYDKNAPVPQDGRGKAEIEVFRLTEKASVARINTSSKRNPIVSSDIVANLIWDSKDSNKFVVSGDFDFDGDGKVDPDGRERIEQLVERWGGTLVDEVSIDTDFIVLGYQPKAMARPTREDIDFDPSLDDKYSESLKHVRQHHEVLTLAGTLNVPVFNQKRFMYLIGYESLASKISPF